MEDNYISSLSKKLAIFSNNLNIKTILILLVSIGALFFITEIGVMSYGLLSLAGVVSIFLGSTMLIDSDDPTMQISQGILYPTMGLAIVFSIGIAIFATRARDLKKQGGAEGMIGETGIVKEELNPWGRILVHGELWQAECEGKIKEGEKVYVEKVERLKVKVRKIS